MKEQILSAEYLKGSTIYYVIVRKLTLNIKTQRIKIKRIKTKYAKANKKKAGVYIKIELSRLESKEYNQDKKKRFPFLNLITMNYKIIHNWLSGAQCSHISIFLVSTSLHQYSQCPSCPPACLNADTFLFLYSLLSTYFPV